MGNQEIAFAEDCPCGSFRPYVVAMASLPELIDAANTFPGWLFL